MMFKLLKYSAFIKYMVYDLQGYLLSLLLPAHLAMSVTVLLMADVVMSTQESQVMKLTVVLILLIMVPVPKRKPL